MKRLRWAPTRLVGNASPPIPGFSQSGRCPSIGMRVPVYLGVQLVVGAVVGPQGPPSNTPLPERAHEDALARLLQPA
jgi:hypothetical protein